MSVLVLILDKKERIVNFLNTNNSSNKSNSNPIYDDVLVEDVKTGAETFSFSTICKNGIDKDLVVGNYVAFQKDGSYKLFQITKVEITHGETFEISVYSECAGLSLINNVFRKTTLNSCTIQRFIEAVVENTDWNLGKVDFSIQNTVDLDIPDTSCYAALQNNISKFECEIEFRVEINNGRISKKFIDVYTRRGKVTGKRFTYGKDIENVIKTSDSTELRTALIGIGKNGTTFRDVQVEGINKPIGQDFVADEKAFEMYNKNGYHLMGVYNVDSTSPEEILRETYKQLKKVCEPKVSYDVPVFMLGNDVNIGDYIGIFDSEFNPPLKLMARVIKLETSFTDTQKNRCLLANFVEVSSNITDEMRKLASELEGYVDNSVNAKFPIGGEDIKDDAIKGNHIYENTITTNHLQANAVTADKINADSIETKHLKADSIDANKIKADAILAKHIKAGEIEAGHIKTGTITAESGIIADAAIGTAQIKDAQITIAKIQDAFIDNLVVKQGKFQSAHIGELTSDNIKTGAIATDKLDAKSVTADKIAVGAITADKIDAGAITTDKLGANSVTAEKVHAGAITTDKIDAGAVTAEKIHADAITTDKIDAEAITSDKIAAGAITAGKLAVDSVISGNISAGAITTDKLGALSVTAEKIAAGTITAEKINADTINSIGINASEITADKIASGEIKVGDANIVDGTISGAKITKASISNAQINEAFIADAYVKNITAEKIKGGILDAKNITVKNLSAESITVGQINGTQIAPGAIGKDKLDEILSAEIKNTSDNVDKALKDIGLVKNEVTNVTTIANGKNSIYYSSSAPSVLGKKENDIWYDTDDGYKMYYLKSGAWVATQFGTNAIVSNAITADKINTGAITAGKIDTGAVTTDKLYALSVTADKVAANAITAGKIAANAITAVNISSNAITSDKIIAGSINSEKLDVDELFVGENAFIRNLKAIEIDASNITTGKISSERLDITGLVSFEAFDKNLKPIFDTSGDKTYINGGMIATNSIKAEKIDVKGLTVKNEAGKTTLAVTKSGDIQIDGLLQSENFESDSTGYQISTDGSAEFNQVKLRGDVILPNAGITNFGATIGNENLLSDSLFREVEPRNNGTDSDNYNYTRLYVDMTLNETYTISADVEITKGSFDKITVLAYSGGGSWHINIINGKIKHTFTKTVDTVDSVLLYAGEAGSTRDQGAIFRNIKIEKGTISTPYCPKTGEKTDYVRFWAGSSYEGRNEAPFRVLQNGKVFATEGTFDGTFTGKIKVGNISIEDTNTTDGAIEIKTNDDLETVVKLSNGQSFINAPLTIGNTRDKNFEFNGNVLNVNKSVINVDVGNINKVSLNENGIDMNSKISNGKHSIHYGTEENKKETLLIESNGSKGNDGDVNFLRKSGTEDVKVKVIGEMSVKSKITSDTTNIEMRYQSDGIYFYAT